MYRETDPQMLEIKVKTPLDFGNCHEYDFPLKNLIEQLQESLDSQPKDVQGKVMFRISQHGDRYDGYYPVESYIYYEREETEDEVQQRIKQQREWDIQTIKNKEEELERHRKRLGL